jgi:hypothetical protein
VRGCDLHLSAVQLRGLQAAGASGGLLQLRGRRR